MVHEYEIRETISPKEALNRLQDGQQLGHVMIDGDLAFPDDMTLRSLNMVQVIVRGSVIAHNLRIENHSCVYDEEFNGLCMLRIEGDLSLTSLTTTSSFALSHIELAHLTGETDPRIAHRNLDLRDSNIGGKLHISYFLAHGASLLGIRVDDDLRFYNFVTNKKEPLDLQNSRLVSLSFDGNSSCGDILLEGSRTKGNIDLLGQPDVTLAPFDSQERHLGNVVASKLTVGGHLRTANMILAFHLAHRGILPSIPSAAFEAVKTQGWKQRAMAMLLREHEERAA